MTTKTQWDWWVATLAAKKAGTALPPIHEGKPQSGCFYASAGKNGGRIPVLIIDDANGEKSIRVGTEAEHQIMSADEAARRWTWVAENVVSKADYMTAWTTGTWADGTPTKAPALPAGSNLPTDPFERLLAEVNDKMSSAEQFASEGTEAIDKTRADRARNMQAELLAFLKNADAMHKAEKQPHLDAGRAVDEKFRFREKISALAKRLYNIYDTYVVAEDARLRAEADRKHKEEQARILAERAKIEQERKRQAVDDPIAFHTSPAPELPELPLAPPPVPKVNVGGGVGRAAGVRTDWKGEIENYDLVVEHFKAHDDVRELMQKLVDRAVKASKSQATIPGVKVREVRKAA